MIFVHFVTLLNVLDMASGAQICSEQTTKWGIWKIKDYKKKIVKNAGIMHDLNQQALSLKVALLFSQILIFSAKSIKDRFRW